VDYAQGYHIGEPQPFVAPARNRPEPAIYRLPDRK
jgi:hypothetical protein